MVAVAVVISLLLASLPATSNTKQVLTRQDRAGANSEVRASFSTRLYHGLSQTLGSLGSWLGGYRNTESTASTYYPVGAFLTPAPPFIDAPTNLTVTAASSTGITLGWTAPAGSVTHYQIERSTSVSGPFLFLANASGTTHNDTTVTNLQAYLYRVRAVASGGLPSAPSNMALGAAISFQFSSLQGQQIRAQHFYDVRTAINAVRAVAGLAAATWTRTTLAGLEIKADDVLELRTKLNEALTALGITVTAFQDATLTTGANGTLIKAIHIEQLQTRSTRGSSNGSGPLDSDSSTARLDPLNQTGGGGENPLSRNFNWNLPLVSLPGRAGLDLGLSLSYNSLVWTRSGNAMLFDSDAGFPSPGFRLGFPAIQPLYYNTEVGKYAFLLIASDGSRTELRQVGTSALYEAADSSHLLLDTSTLASFGSMTLKSTDGTQLTYKLKGSEYQCTEIKDRNGNYLTINYTGYGRIDTVIDTLARSIKFNYDAQDRLTSITQVWNQGLANEVTHNWAVFAYTDIPIQTNFSGLVVFGPANNSTIKMLSKVTLADDSHSDFSYTSWGQVWKVSNYAADNHLLNYRSYNLPQTAATAHSDCPRFTERRDWAQYWNGDTEGTPAVNEEATTAFIVPVSDTWTMPDNTQASGVRTQVTTPDGTVNKIYFMGAAGTASGWRRGLPALVETHSGSAWQRKVMTTWTQDNTSVSYPLNPRVLETNVYDPAGNRARVQITYQQQTFANGTSCQLPRDVYEYAANATTILRSTRTDYHMSTEYTNRRIIGLVTEKRLYEGNVNSGGVLMSRVGFFYDNENSSTSIQGNDAPVQHDNTNYTASFVTGRANLSSVRRYDVNNTAQFTTTRSKYNTTGAVVSTSDALDHITQISYTDSFSDGIIRNTRAYPTTITDPDNYTSTTKYNFDFGAVTYRRTPQPNTTQNLPGPEQVLTYDTIGRPQQVTNQVNGAYTRFVHPNSMTRVDTYATIQEGLGEAHSFKSTDGAGRLIGAATQHPGSIGGYSGQRFVYDVMGRVIKTSNPTETNASGAPLQWVAAGDDAAVGWIYSQQTYDWKGRPLVTTNQDGTTKAASYTGCGCAGGEVVTLTDEGTLDGGVAKRRQQKLYSDVLGRTVKTEVLNWDGAGPNGTGGSVYSATVNTYNARDQLMLIREYAGPEGSLNYQDTMLIYDGYARLINKHVPEQNAGANTAWTYNADDTIHSVTDARGASATYGYNARHLPVSINHSAPTGITPTANATFGYDAAGNRTSMTDGLGSMSYQYDLLSRMNSETRQFTTPGAPSGNFTLSYEYTLAGAIKKVTDERSATSFSTSYDSVGRISAVTAVGYGGANTTFISDKRYRAWGAAKSVIYGNGTTLNVSYDNRLRMAAQVVAGFRMSWIISPPVQPFSIEATYQYYADGRLKLATRRNPSGIRGDLRTHDRAFAYDHAGRVAEGYSGGEAHQFLGDNNSGVGEGPYRLSFTYDTHDNMLSGGGRYWSRANEANAVFNNQNRNPNWEYDADGRLLSQNEPPNFPPSQPLRVTYDAAGQSSLTTQAREYFEPVIQQMVTISLTNSQTFDGDGVLIRYKKERLYSTLPANNSVEVTFHLRSTLLGGVGISEYSASGAWQRGQVYAGREVVGEQSKSADGSQPRAVFRQRDPLMGDELNSRENGDYAGESVIDPQGVDVAGIDPFPADGSGDPDGNVTPNPFVPAGRGEGMLLATGESGMKCVLDGITVDCASVGSFAVQCPENDCGPRTRDQYDLDGKYLGGLVTSPFQAFTDGWSGFTLSGTRYVGDALILGRFWTDGPSERIGRDSLGFGTRAEAYSAHFLAPQQKKRTPTRKQRIRRPADDLPSSGPQEPAKPSHDRGSPIRPQEVISQLTGAQCAALRKLLLREAELGTIEAAARSQISYPYPNNDRLINDFNSSANQNIILDDGTQIDLDWWTTLAGVTTPDASLLSVHNTYVIAKTTWSLAKRSTTGNPIPYQDPGERWAVLYTATHQSFSSVFDEKFMNRECGPNSRHR